MSSGLSKADFTIAVTIRSDSENLPEHVEKAEDVLKSILRSTVEIKKPTDESFSFSAPVNPYGLQTVFNENGFALQKYRHTEAKDAPNNTNKYEFTFWPEPKSA